MNKITPKVNYVLATWSGPRRGGTSGSHYLKKHIQQLLCLKHSLSEITIVVADNPQEPQDFTEYLHSLPKLSLPINILRRPNIGLSYGSYSEAYEKYRTQFDYYIFIEDDYYFIKDNFDTELISFFQNQPNCGYVCGFISRTLEKQWMGNSIGLSSSQVLETVRNKFGKLPYDSGCLDGNYSLESGQITFSNAFSDFQLLDITSKYSILHYYWQHRKVLLIPGQANPDKPSLFLPYESTPNIAFNYYYNRHLGQSAIVYATGPSLNKYDFLEDDGKKLRVGVNGIANKNIFLDYYFCGHKDTRSAGYLAQMKNYQVKGRKFGYVSIDGMMGPDWLGIDEALHLGLQPYELTSSFDFQFDISQHPVVNHLIIFSALQFLIYSGVKEIYLVGSDATQAVSCDDPTTCDLDRSVDIIYNAFKEFKAFAAKNQVRIISVNPVGLTGLFEDIFR